MPASPGGSLQPQAPQDVSAPASSSVLFIIYLGPRDRTLALNPSHTLSPFIVYLESL